MCDQQTLRSACAYAQSDQSLSLSLGYSMSVKLLPEHHLEFLSLKGGCRGSNESTHVKMPHCWKFYATAHILACLCSCPGWLEYYLVRSPERQVFLQCGPYHLLPSVSLLSQSGPLAFLSLFSDHLSPSGKKTINKSRNEAGS